MCDFKVCILLEFKKKSKHAKRHLFVWYLVLTRKIECLTLAMPFCKDLVSIFECVCVRQNNI